MAKLVYHNHSDADVLAWAHYYVMNNSTIRKTAEKFKVSKSTVHKALATKLCGLDAELYVHMSAVCAKNKAERHLRGGIALAKKYKDKKK